jgi:hypothetical protein
LRQLIRLEAHAVVEGHNEVTEAVEPTEAHAAVENHSEVSEAAEHEEHLTHVLHQLQKTMGGHVACIFFMLISILAFYAIQQVAQAGWSPVLFRVMQGITAIPPVGSVLFFIF